MQAQLQQVKVEAVRRGDHDLAVDHAAVRQRADQPVVQLRKVAIQRLEIPALDVGVASAAKDDRAKAVPLRLEEEITAAWNLLGHLREHRLDGRRDGKGGHQSMLTAPNAGSWFGNLPPDNTPTPPFPPT